MNYYHHQQQQPYGQIPGLPVPGAPVGDEVLKDVSVRAFEHIWPLMEVRLDEKLALGNLDSKRDWGYAPEYVDAMWRMLQADSPRDFVIGTGEHNTPREFCRLAFERVGLNYEDHVRIDPQFLRPAEVDTLLADASLAASELQWKPQTSFRQLAELMVDSEMERAKAAS